MSKSADENRFEADAGRYAAYLATPEGRLRIDLPFRNLREFLPSSFREGSLSALDVGGGTGAAAVCLGHLGMCVTLLDSSAKMLELAQKAIADAELTRMVAVTHGDVSQLSSLFDSHSFDVVLCHNVLEFVDDPRTVLCELARLMRNSSSVLSILVRNQAGEVLKAALGAGDLAVAERTLTTAWAQESLYGGQLRLFTPETLETLLHEASVAIKARRGVRVFADYLPAQISRATEYERIRELEHQLGKRQEFYGVARYLHCVAGPLVSAAEE